MTIGTFITFGALVCFGVAATGFYSTQLIAAGLFLTALGRLVG